MKKVREFDHDTVASYYEDVVAHLWTYRALAMLLTQSSLEFFADDPPEGEKIDLHASNLRWGLQQILERLADFQEKKVEELFEASYNCPEEIIKRAADLINLIPSCSDFHRLRHRYDELLDQITEVAAKFGDKYPEAKALEVKILRASALKMAAG